MPVLLPLVLASLAFAPSPRDPDLAATIADRDIVLFQLMFDRCEPQILADMISEDLEFYHDVGGLMATRETFVADYARNCEARQAPDAFRSRRERVADSFQVHPIPGVGAVAEGTHRFYERRGDGPERLVGSARFSMLWRLEDGQWRIARVFSIDHKAESDE